jgi:hypothetical protein
MRLRLCSNAMQYVLLYSPLGRRERSELRAAKPLAQQRGQQFAALGARCANSKSPPCPCRRFPEGPRTARPPRVSRSPALFSARSQHTRWPDGVWFVCRPLELLLQRHSTHHLLHYWSPSGLHFCFRSAPSGVVQRTGCSACGLGYPHQVWWAPPMYIARAWPR